MEMIFRRFSGRFSGWRGGEGVGGQFSEGLMVDIQGVRGLFLEKLWDDFGRRFQGVLVDDFQGFGGLFSGLLMNDGPTCLQCGAISNPTDCHSEQKCQADEVCACVRTHLCVRREGSVHARVCMCVCCVFVSMRSV